MRAAGDVAARARRSRAGARPLLLATGGFAAPARARARSRAAREPVERGRRARRGPPARRLGDGRDGRVLRPRDARAAGALGRAGLRARLAALRPLRRGRWTSRATRSGTARWPGTRTTCVQALARRPGGVGWYRVAGGRARRPRPRADGRRHGRRGRAPRRRGRARRGRRPREGAGGGHAHDRRAPDRRGRPRASAADGLWAAGADAGGIFTGGYASGLAAALVFGRRAAESVDRITRR